MGIVGHTAERAFVRSDTDVKREDLAHNQPSNSSQWCSVEVRPLEFPPHQTHQTMSLWSWLCAQGSIHAGTEKGLTQSGWKSTIV